MCRGGRTVRARVFYHSLHVLGEELPTAFSPCCYLKTMGIAPAPNRDHDRRAWTKPRTRLLDGSEHRPGMRVGLVEDVWTHES